MVIKTKTGAAPHMDVFVNSSANPAHFIIDVAGYFYRHTRTCTEVAGTSTAIATGTTATLDTPTCPANFAFDHGGCEVLSGITGAVHVRSSRLRVTAAPDNKPFWRCQIHNSGAIAATAIAAGVCCSGN
jgi:hypothetical protein